jgi:predicted GIY-YIG superfamily endonuclease
MELYLFVFKLKEDKYYLGFTTDYERAFVECRAGFGPEWTKKYIPISVDLVIENAESYHETQILYKYFKKYGIDAVRGGPYHNMVLTNEQIESIQAKINSIDETGLADLMVGISFNG